MERTDQFPSGSANGDLSLTHPLKPCCVCHQDIGCVQLRITKPFVLLDYHRLILGPASSDFLICAIYANFEGKASGFCRNIVGQEMVSTVHGQVSHPNICAQMSSPAPALKSAAPPLGYPVL